MFLPDVPGHLIGGQPLSASGIDLAELTARFEWFLHEVYHRRPHGTTGEAPVARWQAGGFLPALPESRAALDMARCCGCPARARLRATASASWTALRRANARGPSWASRLTSSTTPAIWPRSTSTTTVRSYAVLCAPSMWTPPSLAQIRGARRGAKKGLKQSVAADEARHVQHNTPAPDRAPTEPRFGGLKLYAADD